MRVLQPTVAVALLAATGLSAQNQKHEVLPASQHYLDLTRPVFSAQRAYDQVAFMDQYFRWPGNTGFNASIHRVEDILKTAGYVAEPANGKPSDVLTYRIEHRPIKQPAWEPVDASVTIVGESSPVLSFATNRNMLAIGSFSTPDSGVLAQLVDVGKGTPADYDKAPVAGKIVLADGNVGRVFGEAVQKRGAIGVLAYNMPAYTQPTVYTHSIQFGSIAYDSVKKSWGMPISHDALDRLRGALGKGPVTLRVKTKSKMYPSDELTLVAEVHGSVAPSERYVVSAHVQEPGTNDNASGVGDLSEMARVLATLVKNGSIKPKRTITMLFGLEIAQTRNFLADDSVRTRGVHWGLSLDMTGEDTKKTGGTFLIEKMPDPSAIWTRGEEHHTEWGGRAITKAELVPHYYNDYLLGRCLDQAAATGWVVRTNPFEGGSDHTPFLQFKKPGALFWHFTDAFYHTDGDRLDKVSKDELMNVGNASLAAILTMTSADGTTARSLVAEVERAALARLDVETALSKTAVAAGKPAADERDIISTWTDYYIAAIHTMTDIEVGGSSKETLAAIDAAANRVKIAGDQHLAILPSERRRRAFGHRHGVTSLCAWLVAHGSSCLELVAVTFGIVSVLLSVRENIWSWPTALVNVALYFALFSTAGLYSDMGLQVVYFGLSLYGWYEWLYGGKGMTALLVSRTPMRVWGVLAAIGIVVWVILGALTSRLPGVALPYVDAATTTVSLLAQWMMTRKLLENWTVWVAVDVVYICMFIFKGLYLTAANYAVYLVLALLGHFAWKRSLAASA